VARKAKKSSKAAPATAAPEGPVDAALFTRLKAVRRILATERNVPAFVIFSDRTLREMARRKPATEAELRSIPGVGPAKLATFGAQFLAAITSR
jgi:ATP-dependent DNA helicase RecQ